VKLKRKEKGVNIMDNDNKLENVLRKLALFVGLALLAGSMYLSYDGFDQTVNGGNAEYTILAVLIGWSLAIAVTILEFILSSRPEGLNVTLKVIGVVAYGYSIWTNYLGATDLLHMDKTMAVVVALFMDIVPEPMIAWGLGEAIMHDLFKNLGGFATAPVGKGRGNNQRQQQKDFRPQQNNNNHQKGGGGGGQQFRPSGGGNHNSGRRAELEKTYHMAGSGNGNGSKPQKGYGDILAELEEEDE
jgi:hypothetical protein